MRGRWSRRGAEFRNFMNCDVAREASGRRHSGRDREENSLCVVGALIRWKSNEGEAIPLRADRSSSTTTSLTRANPVSRYFSVVDLYVIIQHIYFFFIENICTKILPETICRMISRTVQFFVQSTFFLMIPLSCRQFL